MNDEDSTMLVAAAKMAEWKKEKTVNGLTYARQNTS